VIRMMLFTFGFCFLGCLVRLNEFVFTSLQKEKAAGEKRARTFFRDFHHQDLTLCERRLRSRLPSTKIVGRWVGDAQRT